MKTLPILALALSGLALAQKPATNPCALTAGLEVGMSREAAFENMRYRVKDLKTQNVKTFHHAPPKRGYTVDVTFASEAPSAKVTGLRYSYEPAGVFDALRERFGEPGSRPAPGSWRWDLSRCGTTLTYHAMEDEHHQVVGEEVTVEAAPAKSK